MDHDNIIDHPSSKAVSLETALRRLPYSSISVSSFGDAKTLTSLSSKGSSSEGSTEIGSLADDSFSVPSERISKSACANNTDTIKSNGLTRNEFQEAKLDLGLSSATTPPNFQVRVGIRVRPNPFHLHSSSASNILNCDTDFNTVEVDVCGSDIKSKRFTYDAVFDEHTTQSQLYHGISSSMLDTVLDGYNATIMAYGQTGSGKTYTMGISSDATTLLRECENFDGHTDEISGLIPRFMTDLFRRLAAKKSGRNEANSFEYEVSTSFLEVYGDDVYDLLAPATQKQQLGKEKNVPSSLRLREERDGKVTCVGLTDRICMNARETLVVLQDGSVNRTTASTAMNNSSSRSHAIFSVTIKQSDVVQLQNINGDSTKICNAESSSLVQNTTVSQFTFVDLAGSERLLKTCCVGQQAKEGIQINQGLLALGNVIHALASKEDEDINASSRSKTPPKRSMNRTKSYSPLRNGTKPNTRNRSITPKRNQSNTPHRRRNNTFIPYRDSRLTRLLQDALGGNSQTYFLACVSSNIENRNETLSTLQYANRARNIRNAPKIKRTTDGSSNEKLMQEVEQLRTLVATLKADLQKWSQEEDRVNSSDVDSSSTDHHIALSLDPSCIDKTNKTDIIGHQDSEKTPPCSCTETASEQHLSKSSLSFQNQKERLSDNNESLTFSIKVSEEMAAHEIELQDLRQHLLGYEDIRAQYNQLMSDVRKLEQEKDQLTSELDALSNEPTKTSSLSEARNKRIESINHALQIARAETTKQRQVCRKAEQDASRCRLLESKILEMNKCLAVLTQQRNEESRRHQRNLNEKNHEIFTLKRKEFTSEKDLSKLKATVGIYQRKLDHQQEVCIKLTQQLKQTETVGTRKLLSSQLKQNQIRNRIDNLEVTRQVQGDDNTASNKSKTANAVLHLDDRDIAPISPEIQVVYELLEKCIREKVKFAQLTEEFGQLESKYNDASQALDSTELQLNEVMKKSETLSPESNIGSMSIIADDFVELDETQNYFVEADGSAELIYELENKMRQYVTEISSYEDELEGMELKLSRCEERDAYENTAMRKLITNKSAPVVRTLFLGLVDRLAQSEVRFVEE
jgi:outer membrane murein-binding lipoprotein Lpp